MGDTAATTLPDDSAEAAWTTATDERLAVPQVAAARMLGVTDRTIRKWERAGVLSGKRVRGVKLYAVAKLKELAGVK